MAQASPSIFNKRATERLRSPDDLEKYVQVTNPSVWVVLGACIALLAGLLAWGIFGTVSTNVSAQGVRVDDQVVCFLSVEDAARVHIGDAASVDGSPMKVSAVSVVPLSRDEAGAALSNDYLMATLFEGDWAYQVVFEGEAQELSMGVPLTVSITTERIAPISLVLGGDR